MLTFERREAIKKILEENKTATVEELSDKFFVSQSTIRRDLEKISGSGAIRRTYGGAVMLENLASELPISIREHENTDAKQRIASNAVRYIQDGSTIILDTSSTVTAMIPYLNNYDGLTVITNGIKTAYLLNSYSKITTYCTGGRLREHNMSLVGAATCSRFGELNADVAFISCRGISTDKGVTEASEEEASVKKAVLEAASRVVLLCDSSKFDMVLMNRVCALERIDAFVTDIEPPENYVKYFTEHGIEIIY